MARYNSYRILNNSNEYYKKLRQKRNKKNIKHFETPILRHPTIAERSSLETVAHVWTIGDRFYKLAEQYYENPQFWWIIAWYNGMPTEAHIFPGYQITIPLDIEQVINTFGI